MSFQNKTISSTPVQTDQEVAVQEAARREADRLRRQKKTNTLLTKTESTLG